MLYRDFGRTGIKVSVIGFGAIVVSGETQDFADRAVAEAIDRGVNYFDVAPGYGDAEERLGPALKGRRDGITLACKTGQRTKDGAEQELHRSLTRLQTDHLDLYQLHGVPNLEELNTMLAPGGAMEALQDAKEKGLTRFIGVTCHDSEVALEAMRSCDLDSVLFPVNFIYWLNKDAGQDVLTEAAARGVARAAIKSMASGPWPEGVERRWHKCWYRPFDDPAMIELAVRFTLSQDVNVMMPSGHLELFRIALDAADRFRPLDEAEETRLRELAQKSEAIF